MICPACQDDNHSACDSLACECAKCNYGLPIKKKTACQLCGGCGLFGTTNGAGTCPRCQGSGRELADLAGLDRINGRHFMEGS